MFLVMINIPGCVSCELVCVCVSLARVVIFCLASTHTALVSSLTVLHLPTYPPALACLCMCMCACACACACAPYRASVQSERACSFPTYLLAHIFSLSKMSHVFLFSLFDGVESAFRRP